MTPDILYSLVGLFQAIAVMCAVLFVAGGFCYAVARVFFDSDF